MLKTKLLQQQHSSLLRVVVFGPESTGKTTLCKDLAAHYNTLWVPEFARDFLQKKWDTTQEVCTLEDLLTIAQGQMDLENEALKNANKIFFCDTSKNVDITITVLWCCIWLPYTKILLFLLLKVKCTKLTYVNSRNWIQIKFLLYPPFIL